MKRMLAAVLAVLLLCGCAPAGSNADNSAETTLPSAGATVPADGNPEDVTCKGTYTREGDPAAVIAQIGDTKLTNEALAVWYWAAAAQYQASGKTPAPDFDAPLDSQPCEADTTVGSWQQYFLRQALNTWHTAAALNQQSLEVPLNLEPEYQPDPEKYATYMDGMPATKFLYGYNRFYSPNTMHQAYLDSLPDTLKALAGEKGFGDTAAMAQDDFGTTQAALTDMAQLLNRAYMYFTTLTYDLTQPEAAYTESTDGDYLVNIKHILLKTDGKTAEETLAAFRKEAKTRLQPLTQTEQKSEAAFKDLAHLYSQDEASALDGGGYNRVKKGELPAELDAWCFDPARQSGDTTAITDDDGVHILYFSGRLEEAEVAAADESLAAQEADLLEQARTAYPVEFAYDQIALPEGKTAISTSDLLYPDIAHERFPEIPLYLQQDYPGVMFGGFLLRTNGCGITTMAMVASYLSDELLTPPEMCRRYGGYSHRNGTDGMIFVKEPSVMDFYLMEKTYEPTKAWEGLENHHLVVSIQHKGYWTRGGHYIALQEITEDGNVRVRDSNIYNYVRVPAHVNDEHTWASITSAGSGYWIFDYKITRIPGCARCGDQSESSLVGENFYCRKCAPAVMRRNAYLGM